MTGQTLTFPPLMWGEEATDTAFDHAVMKATLGCEAGLIAYKLGSTHMEAALVFAPEVPLSNAMAMLHFAVSASKTRLVRSPRPKSPCIWIGSAPFASMVPNADAYVRRRHLMIQVLFRIGL